MVRVKRKRRKWKKPPLWRRQPEIVILVCLGVGVAAALIIAGALGLIESVDDMLGAQAEEGEALEQDTAEARCMDLHAQGGFLGSNDFSCEMPCNACHDEDP